MGKLKTKPTSKPVPQTEPDAVKAKKVTFALNQEVFKLKPIDTVVEIKETPKKTKEKNLLKKTQFKAKTKSKTGSTFIKKVIISIDWFKPL